MRPKKNTAASPHRLTIVVAIIGIFAAVAIPAFLDYMKRARQTEASLKPQQDLVRTSNASSASRFVAGLGRRFLPPARRRPQELLRWQGRHRGHPGTTTTTSARPTPTRSRTTAAWRRSNFGRRAQPVQYSYKGDTATPTGLRDRRHRLRQQRRDLDAADHQDERRQPAGQLDPTAIGHLLSCRGGAVPRCRSPEVIAVA